MIRILLAMINMVLHYLSGFFPRKKNQIIFGAWGGKKYADNSKYLFEYLLTHKKYKNNYTLIWIGNKELENSLPKSENVLFVKKNSIRNFYYALTSKYAFITNNYNDICRLSLLKGAIVTQLWHGGGPKRILADDREHRKQNGNLGYSLWIEYLIGKNTFNRCDYFVTYSPVQEEVTLSAFKFFGVKENRIIKHGQPRSDFLIKNNNKVYIQKIREHFNRKYNIPIDKKIVLYLPTFREHKTVEEFTFTEALANNQLPREFLIKNHIIILEKSHLRGEKKAQTNCSTNALVYNLNSVDENFNTEDLLLISDFLITDYSGCYLDYLLLDRPIIHFAYDYESYKKQDRGFRLDLEIYNGGEVVHGLEDLLKSLKTNLQNPNVNKEQRHFVRKELTSYEKGESCKKIIETVFGSLGAKNN